LRNETGNRNLAVANTAKPGVLKEIVLDALESRSVSYLSYRAEFLKEGSRSTVHCFRTSIRRLEALLEALSAIRPGMKELKLREQIDCELKALSVLRDTQVQKNKLKAGKLPGTREKKLKKQLDKIERDEYEKATRSMGGEASVSRRLVKTRRSTRKNLEDLPADRLRDSQDQLLRQLQRNLLKIEMRVLDLAPKKERNFHKLRIDLKNVLYKLEIFSELLRLKVSEQKQLEELRSKLGRLQDQIAFLETIRTYPKSFKKVDHLTDDLNHKIHRRESEIIRFAQNSHF
jgi:CHAD domain-containing protein